MVAEDLVGDTAVPTRARSADGTITEPAPAAPTPVAEPAAPAPEVTTPVLEIAAPATPAAVAVETADQTETPEKPEKPVRRQRWRAWLRVLWIPLEIAVCLTAALWFPYWAKDIEVDPMNRIGQVSGLAELQLRLAAVLAAVVVVLVVAHKLFSPYWRDVVVRIGCAIAAGLSTGLVAGGITVALRDTPYPLWGGGGDYGWILAWVDMLMRGEEIPAHYGPMPFHIIADWAERYDQLPIFALQDLQIFGTALYGPAAYLAWRLTLRPMWALGIGVLATMPFLEPVKPYPQLALVAMVPVLVALLHRARHADRLHPLMALLYGALLGGLLGLLFQLYTGWFVWCAGGAVVAFLIVTPWRRGWLSALLLGGSAVLVFLRITWTTVLGLLAPTGATSDRFFYFDTDTEPTYFAMWRNDRPGADQALWPPPGELGGVGVFTILLALGIGAALYFGWRRSAVIGLGCFALSAWVMRMWLASDQFETMTVRLYPRTTMVLLHCSLLLVGFAILYGVQAGRRTLAHRLTVPNPGGTLRASVPAGLMMIPIMFLIASAGDATASRYMPETKRSDSVGYYSWVAHMKRLPDGSCARWGLVYGCRPLPKPRIEKDVLPDEWPAQRPVIKPR